MAVIEELIRLENNGELSFGNYLMDTKKKVHNFEVGGDLYNVKTFRQITKLEKNSKLLFESVPGTAIHNFIMDDRKVAFKVESEEDAQLTMELEAEKEYKIYIDDVNVGHSTTNLAGKINFGVETSRGVVNVVLEKIN